MFHSTGILRIPGNSTKFPFSWCNAIRLKSAIVFEKDSCIMTCAPNDGDYREISLIVG